MSIGDLLPFPLGQESATATPLEVVTRPSAWTIFDSDLQINTYTVATGNIVVITHLPTGMQEACGRYEHQLLNQNAAMTRLKVRVVT